jgi:predicted MFS family arabinose efflux permease
VATVLGVPAGLELARLGGWRTLFFAEAAFGAVITLAVLSMLPPQRAHLSADHRAAPVPFRDILKRRVVQLAIAGTASFAIANFALFQNLSAYFQFNRGYPIDRFDLLYMIGGAISFATVRIAGRLSDRHGAPPITTGGAAAYAAVLAVGFIYSVDAIPVLPLFVGILVVQGFRSVPMQALSSRIPEPHERARFMSAQASAQYLAQTAGAVIGAQLLTEHADGSLVGINHVAWFAVAMSLVHAAISYAVNRRVHAPLRTLHHPR